MLEEGEIIVAGTDLTKLNRKELGEYRRKKIGVVFQAYNLIAELNVRENIRVVQDISEAPLSMDELLEDLGIARHAGSFPSELSGGQQQRCAIGRALIKNSEILLCDEPTGALDSASARDVLGLLFSFPFAKAFCGFYFADAEYLDYVVRLPWKLMLVAFLIPIVVYGVVSYLVLCRVLSSDIVPEYGFNGLPAAGRESVPDSRYCVEAVEGAGNADLRDDCCDDVRDDRGGEPEKYFHARCAGVSHGIFHDPCRGAVLGNDYEPAGQSGDNPEQLSVCRRGIPAGNAFIRTEAEEGGHGREPEMCVGVNGNKPDGLVLPFKIIRQETPTSCRS